MKKIYFAMMVVLMCWSCSEGMDWDGPAIVNKGHSDCLMSTDAEYLATKEIQTDSVVVSYDGNMLHIEHHNMVLDCSESPSFRNYLTIEGDTLVVHEDVGEQGQVDCFCLYDNWLDVAELGDGYGCIKIVVESMWCGNQTSYVVYCSSLWLH
ncbi:MAG: hypothetical protein MJZ99_11500 [Bacteroidales bacterium]|nr:hypothetical protein [Candidatus Colimorpha merdihippi]MCQ2283226.1 hypothetical protein [Bacteroidales bacterium]